MTCLSCEKCHSHEFEQLTPFYDKDGLKQVFKCKNCGEEIHLDPRFSGIIIEGLENLAADVYDNIGWMPDRWLSETIRRLWLEIEDTKKKLSEFRAIFGR
jgi:hypothetical protein